MLKKKIALMLASVLCMGTVAVHGGEVEWDDDPTDVTWYIWSLGNVTEDGVAKIEEKINEITLPKINVNVDLVMLDMGTYMTQMPMDITANQQVDLITCFPAAAGSFRVMANNGQLLPLTDLLDEYAPEMLEILPDDFCKSTTVKGEIYAVPVLQDYENDLYFMARENILEELGEDIENIKTTDDMTAIMEKAAEAHPELTCMTTAAQGLLGSSGIYINGAAFDPLTTEFICVVPDENGEYTKVETIYEQDFYQDCIHLLNDWYQKGFIAEDAMTNTEDATQNPKYMFSYGMGSLGRVAAVAKNTGNASEYKYVKVTDGWVTSFFTSMLSMGVPVSAVEPEAAVQLMNLCYTDPELKTLVGYGIEGENYQFAENGGIEEIPNSGYNPNATGIFGNMLLDPDTVGEVEVGFGKADVKPDEWTFSPVDGFVLDTDPVENVVAQLNAVYNEYNPLIACGMGDDAKLQEYIDKMYASGMQDLIDEAQRQLDAWYAENK